MPSFNTDRPGSHGSRNVVGYVFVGALLLLAGLLLIWAWLRTDQASTAEGASKTLVVGYQTSPAMALIMIADAQHEFRNVQLKEFQAGKLALQAFLGGTLDVAVAGDVPIGLALLQGQKMKAFAEVIKGSSNEVRMIVRRHAGCDPANAQAYFLDDGSDKKIATSFGGGPQFFAVKFLQSNGIPLKRVKLVSYAPTEIAAAVESNDADGAAIFDPAAARIEGLLGSDSCTFNDPQNYRQHYIAVTRPALLTSGKPDPRLVAFVAALRQAQIFAVAHPDAAKAIVQTKTGIDMETLNKIWPEFQFGVTLDPGLERLWMQEADFYTSQPGASFPTDIRPEYKAVLDYRVVR